MDPVERARSRPRHVANGKRLSIVVPSHNSSYASDEAPSKASSSDDEFIPGPLDVEACRDFIVFELGEEERLPNRETYADGIQVVCSRLIARYGDERIGQAMRIMYDLIENKDNAHGVGDFGDIWAPWRHDHMHRHENFSQPNTPRFPNLILPDTRRWSEIVSVTKVSQALSASMDCPTQQRFQTTVPMTPTRRPFAPYQHSRSSKHHHASTTTRPKINERSCTAYGGSTRQEQIQPLTYVQGSTRASKPTQTRYKDKGVQVDLGPSWPPSSESRPKCDRGEKQHRRHNSLVSDAFKKLGLVRSPDLNENRHNTTVESQSGQAQQFPSSGFRQNLERRLSRRGRQHGNVPPRLPAVRVSGALEWDA